MVNARDYYFIAIRDDKFFILRWFLGLLSPGMDIYFCSASAILADIYFAAVQYNPPQQTKKTATTLL